MGQKKYCVRLPATLVSWSPRPVRRQRWGCNRCGHTFTNLVTKHSRSPVKIIMEAICRDNLGYSARETVRYLTRRSALRARRATANDSTRGSMSPVPSL